MALILTRRSGQAVDFFIGKGDDAEHIGSVTVRFHPDHPDLAQLHFAMSRDVTILRREISDRKRNEAAVSKVIEPPKRDDYTDYGYSKLGPN